MNAPVTAARLVVLAAFLDLFCQFPVVAPYARSLGASPLQIALAVASYDAANLVGNLGAGLVLDGWGRRRALILGLLVAAGSLLLYAVAANALQFALVRAVHGLAQAVLSPGAFAVLSDAVAPPRRAQAMASAGVTIAGAAVVGPPLAGLIGDRLGPQAVFVTVAVLLVAVAGLVARTYRGRDGAPAPRPLAQRIDLRPLLLRRPLLASYGAALAWTTGIGTLVVHLPLVLDERGVAASVRGGAFGVYAVVALLMMARPAPYLANRWGRFRPLMAGLLCIGLALVWLSLGGSVASIYGAMAVFGLGFGLLFPAATSLVADATVPAERGAAFGVFYAAYSLGVVSGAVGSGQLGEVFGAGTGAPFLVSGVLALAVAPLVGLAGRRWRPAAGGESVAVG